MKPRALCYCLLHTTLKILAYNFLTRGNRKFDTFSFGSENQHGTKKGNWHERYPWNSGKGLIYLSYFIYSVIELVISKTFWNYLGMFRDYGLNFFFRNKTCLFFKIESWKFQHLFENEFCETSQSFNSFSSFRQLLFKFFLLVVWLSWNFVRFHKTLFQTDAEIFSFLSCKSKNMI